MGIPDFDTKKMIPCQTEQLCTIFVILYFNMRPVANIEVWIIK